MRHVPGYEFEDDQELEGRSTPFEPVAVSTEAYLVGTDNPNNQSEIIERYLRNERQRSETRDDNYQQQEDLVNLFFFYNLKVL